MTHTETQEMSNIIKEEYTNIQNRLQAALAEYDEMEAERRIELDRDVGSEKEVLRLNLELFSFADWSGKGSKFPPRQISRLVH